MVTRIVGLVGLAALLVACGSSAQQTSADPQLPPAGGEVGGPAPTALTADQLEEINRTVNVGRDGMSSCHAEEMQRENNKKLVGRVTVKILIGTRRVAEQVLIGETTMRSPRLQACIIQTIRGWEFPRIRTAFWYTTTFDLSPAY